MSGHSHAATIKRDKDANDAKKGAAYSKISRLITVAVKTAQGNTDPASNFKLRLALEKAREINMPKENVKRAIEKATGKGDESSLETITYEGYGPAGIAVIVECITDNKNRTASEIKNIFDKSGGNLAEPGAAAHFFQRLGMIKIAKSGDGDNQILAIIDMGVQDIEEKGDSLEAVVAVEKLTEIKEMIAKKFSVLDAEPIMKPTSILDLTAQDKEKVKRFVDFLNAHDDVQKIFLNTQIS